MNRKQKIFSLSVSILLIGFCSLFIISKFRSSSSDYQFNLPQISTNHEGSIPLNREFEVLFIPPSLKAEHAFFREMPKRMSLKKLFDIKNQLLINFWATWCPPCIEEFPSLDYLSRRLLAKKNNASVLLVAISVDENVEEVSELLRTLDFKPSFLILRDEKGSFAKSLGTVKFPETFLAEASGQVLHRWIGPQNWLSEQALELLQKSILKN